MILLAHQKILVLEVVAEAKDVQNQDLEAEVAQEADKDLAGNRQKAAADLDREAKARARVDQEAALIHVAGRNLRKVHLNVPPRNRLSQVLNNDYFELCDVLVKIFYFMSIPEVQRLLGGVPKFGHVLLPVRSLKSLSCRIPPSDNNLLVAG